MMNITTIPEIELPDTPNQPQTQTQPQRSDDWWTLRKHRVKLAMEGNDEALLVINATAISWHVYHNFRMLGIIDASEEQIFHLQKRGKLSVRPRLEANAVEYLVLDLDTHIQRIEIYSQKRGDWLETYEMRAI